jgi:hypothetical protein
MHRLVIVAGLAVLLIATVPSAESALAQTCAPRSPIIAARSSIPVDSSLPECDGRGRPLPETPVAGYVSPLDPDYGYRIYHGLSPVGPAPAEAPAPAPTSGG